MKKAIYKECECCKETLVQNRTNFKRHVNKETGKEEYSMICRKCEEKLVMEQNWKDGKLKCFVCGEWLDPEEFDSHTQYAYRNHKDKRCKQCKRKQNLQARKNYSDEKRLYKILQERWLGARDRARRKNIPFDITKEDLMNIWEFQEGKCAISKIPMTFEMDNGRTYTNVSIDQIIPGKGYTKDNIQLICYAVNQLKSDWDIDTVIYICRQIVDNN